MIGLVPTIMCLMCERAEGFRAITHIAWGFAAVEAAAILYLLGIVGEEALQRRVYAATTHALLYAADHVTVYEYVAEPDAIPDTSLAA